MTDIIDTAEVNTEAWTYSFPADRVADFQHIIDKANRKLERGGATARFEPVITFEDRTQVLESGLSVTTRFARVTMDKLRLSLGQYTFVARLVPEEAGMTVHTAPGESLEGWTRPAADDMTCDHCKTARYRTNLFVVRDEVTGQFIQLGQNCIVLYTGLKPNGLWALNFDDEIREASNAWGDSFGRSRDYSASIAEILGVALACTDGGKGYVSKAKAEASWQESTGGLVQRVLFGIYPMGNKPDEVAERHRIIALGEQGAALAKDDVLIAEVKAAAATLKSGSDYGDNMAIILAAESGMVSRRNINTLASLVAIYHRLREDRAAAAAKPVAAQGFIGAVGERVRDFHVTATSVRSFEGDYGVTTLLVGATDDGHVVKWFASGGREWEPGDRIHFGAATVKAHENYKGTDQTALTRGHKVEVVEA